MTSLLERFIRTFQKAITTEMAAMRRRLGPFEVPLGHGQALEPGDGEPGKLYTFKILTPNDKLVLQAECTLRYEAVEVLVTITDLYQDEITLRAGLDSVAIITPYVAQSRLIRQLLSRLGRAVQPVECRTVHRFQGGERDLVIIDTVDTEPLSPGVLLTDQAPGSAAKNLLNVSLSRARGKLIIIADIRYFKRHASQSVINELLDEASRVGLQVTR
jgi:superfamily I DNA and/or RNA helicase